MKKTTALFSIMLITTFIVLTSCKKNNSGTSPQDESKLQVAIMQNATDQYHVQTDEESLSSDANAAVEANPSFSIASGGTADSSLIAGAVVDNSTITAFFKGIKIIYTGIPVFGIIRTGKITIELVNGNSWIDAGAVLKISFENVKITYGGKSVIYNGTRYIININGGLLLGPGSDSVIYKIRVNASVTFDDNSIFTWWAARKNLYVKSSTTFTSYGDTLVNGEILTMGGSNRYTTNFLIKAPEPIVSNLTCGFDKPVSGVRIFSSDNRDATITFGVEANGSPVNTSSCAYGYKVEWPRWNGQSGIAIISY
jgi:hypothetical protein